MLTVISPGYPKQGIRIFIELRTFRGIDVQQGVSGPHRLVAERFCRNVFQQAHGAVRSNGKGLFDLHKGIRYSIPVHAAPEQHNRDKQYTDIYRFIFDMAICFEDNQSNTSMQINADLFEF